MVFRSVIYRLKTSILIDIHWNRSANLIIIDGGKIVSTGFPDKFFSALINQLYFYTCIAAGMIIILNQHIRGSNWVKTDGRYTILNISWLDGIDIIAILLFENAFLIYMPCAASQELLCRCLCQIHRNCTEHNSKRKEYEKCPLFHVCPSWFPDSFLGTHPFRSLCPHLDRSARFMLQRQNLTFILNDYTTFSFKSRSI